VRDRLVDPGRLVVERAAHEPRQDGLDQPGRVSFVGRREGLVEEARVGQHGTIAQADRPVEVEHEDVGGGHPPILPHVTPDRGRGGGADGTTGSAPRNAVGRLCISSASTRAR
jgi:hypothetical protein